jgi:hypothetical protein
LIGLAAAVLVTAVNAINCASATTITLEVRGDGNICDQVKETGIVVTPPDSVGDTESYKLLKFKEGCANGKVGTLVITPHSSDTIDRNARIGIRVVAGLQGKSANACDDPNGKVGPNCIIAKRTVKFVEGADVPVTVTLNGRCVNYNCPADTTCNPNEPDPDPAKRCVGLDKVPPPPPPGDEDVRPYGDGGPGNADADSGPLTPEQICTAKPGHSWNPSKNLCLIRCGQGGEDCKLPGACPPGLDCSYLCIGPQACENVSCTGKQCEFNCTNDSDDLCKNISCDAGSCNVICRVHENACNGVTLLGTTNTMECQKGGPGQDKVSCDNVRCIPGPIPGTSCARSCDGPAPNACGQKSECDAGDCTKFEAGTN